MNMNEDTSTKDAAPEELMDEILNKDRLLYLKIIRDNKSLTSLEMTREILALKSNTKPEQIDDKKVNKNNPNINTRLKNLVGLGVLNEHNGEYSLSPIGLLFVEELPKLISNMEVLKKYKQFFDAHDYTVIPPQQFREIYKLQFAEQCKDAVDYNNIILDSTGRTEHKIRIATERLHTIPTWIIQEVKQGHVTFELIYLFKNPFKLNSNNEEERNLWKDLTEKNLSNIKLRYLTFERGNLIGIRIIDEKWALFNLFEIAENRLNRPASFYGTHEQYVGWVEDIFISIWNKSKPLNGKDLLIQ